MRGLEEVTGDVGGAAAALWDNCQESNMRPWGEGRKERRVVIHTLKTIMLTDNVVCIT